MEKESSSERDRVNILIVDDHHENLVALSAILTQSDYHIVTALSGRQALSALLKEEFALVVLDVMMPEMDGYQLASMMKERERTQEVPIIFLTAIATDVNHIFKGYSVGAVDYLLKPMVPEIVKAKVAVFADLFRSKQRIKQQAEILREVERQTQEAKLVFQRQESEAWYSTTLKSIGDAVIATDIQGIIRFMSPMAESLTGWTLVDAHGMPIENVFKIINEETRHEIESPVVKVIRDGVVLGLANNTVLISKNGREFLLEDSGAPIRNEKGVLLGVVIVFRDATEKRREAERRSFISKASSILLSSLDYSVTLGAVARLAASSIADCCIVDVAADGGVIERVAIVHADSKEKMIREISKSKSTISGPSVDSFIHSVVRTGKAEIIHKLSDSQLQSLAVSPDDLRADKGLGFKSCICVPLSLRGNHLGAVTLLFKGKRSVFSTKDVQMVEELATRASTAIENSRLYDGAQKAIRLRDEFLSIASHELRTPITPLKLQLQTIKSLASKKMFESYPVEKLDQMFSIADRQMERFQKLIEELLDVSRISAGRLKLEKQEVDMAEIVREIVGQFADEIKNAQCHIEVETVPAMGNWDKLRIEQVLINLLANAMKYGAKNPIKVSVETEGKVARLKVEDHGPGIPKDDQTRIFNRFERAASTRYFPGLGLGLYITKQIVEAHGGTIEVKSQPGQGTTFTVELPLKSDAIQNDLIGRVAKLGA
jgi:PAS domain S-box-containing protein